MPFAGRASRPAGRAGGFTLIEALVALAILGLALAALMPRFGGALRLGSAAEDRRIALLAAQSLLAEIGARPDPAEGSLAGDLGARLRWRAELRPLPLAPEPGRAALPAFEATVEVSGPSGRPLASLGSVVLGRPR